MFSVSEASVAVITGGSSGIGLNAARALRDRGLNVYELSRRAENAEPGVTHLQADVTDETQVNAAVAEILRREGRIDILINNAGFGISGAIEFTPPQEARRQFDVNFFGMVNMNHAVLPVMRQQGGGRIVNMSSVAAPIAIPFQAYYSASKAAVRTYTLALASEVRPFGIEVCVIMPGDIATGFTAARRKSCDGDDVYNGRIARPLRRRDGARRADRYERAVRGAVRCPARHAKASQAHLHHGAKIRPVRVSHAHPADQDRHAHRRPDLRILTICYSSLRRKTSHCHPSRHLIFLPSFSTPERRISPLNPQQRVCLRSHLSRGQNSFSGKKYPRKAACFLHENRRLMLSEGDAVCTPSGG